MPNNATEKIKSAPNLSPKRIVRISFWVLAIAVFVFLLSSFLLMNSSRKVQLGATTYALSEAKTEHQQRKGLGGTAVLEPGKGMIFAYDRAAERCFWMKDMRYPIDIIWVDESGRITAIEREVDPASYPKTFCHKAMYVIEIPAGDAAKNGLATDQQITL